MKLSKKEWSYIFYDWAESSHSAIILAIILPSVFKSVAANAGVVASTSTAMWGYANSIGTLLIALIAPILGSMANFRGYKKKLFTLFLFVGVFFTGMLGTIPDNGYILLLILFTLSLIGYTGANIFYDSFLIDVTTPDRYDLVSTTGFALGYIGGSTIPLIISILLINSSAALGISTLTAARMSFVLTAVWWLVFSIPMLKNVKQEYEVEPQKHIIRHSLNEIKETFKSIRQYRAVILFLFAYFFYIDGVNTVIKMATVYGTDLNIDQTTLMLVLLLTQIVAFPFALLFGFLSKHIKTVYLLLFTITVYGFITVFGYFITDRTGFFILAMLVATSQGGIQALSRSYFASLIPTNKANEFFGFYNIFGRFSAILGPSLVAFVTMRTGKTNNGVLSLLILFVIGFSILLYHRHVLKQEGLKAPNI